MQHMWMILAKDCLNDKTDELYVELRVNCNDKISD